ncbi:unnamed protein product [Cochlearia groenlandica]
MRLKSSLINLKSKFSRSCNRFISLFHTRNVNTTQSTMLSCLSLLSTNKEQRISQIRPRSSPYSLNDDDDDQKLMDSRKMFPLDVTQKNKKPSTSQRDAVKEDITNVREACRSFENYMIHVIVEEGRVDDIMDMEEFIFYWNNLKNPLYIDLVTRFYGELCIDLFPNNNYNDG